MYTPPPIHTGTPRKATPSPPLPQCTSVVSTQSQLKRFCQVEINQQAVVVPLEYIIQTPDKRLECRISGVSFPVSSYREVELEQGPEEDKAGGEETVSVVSLEVPSSCLTSSFSSSTDESCSDEIQVDPYFNQNQLPDINGGLTAQTRRVIPANNGNINIFGSENCSPTENVNKNYDHKYSLIPQCQPAPSSLDVRAISSKEQHAHAICDSNVVAMEDVNTVEILAGKNGVPELRAAIHSTPPPVRNNNQFSVYPGQSEISYAPNGTNSPKMLSKSRTSTINPEVKQSVPPVPHQLSLKSYNEGVKSKCLNHTRISPMDETAVNSLEFVKCVISPTTPVADTHPVFSPQILTQSPNVLAKKQVTPLHIQPAYSPVPSFRPPSELKPIVVSDLEGTRSVPSGNFTKYMDIRHTTNYSSPTHPSLKRTPSPRLDLVETYVEKVKELQTKHHSHRKAVYISPHNFIVRERPRRIRRKNSADRKPKCRSQSSRSSTSSNEGSDIHGDISIPIIPQNLPSFEDFASKVSYIQEIHQIAFIEEEQIYEDKLRNCMSDVYEDIDPLGDLPKIDDFVKQVINEQHHKKFCTFDSDSNDIAELEQKAETNELYETVLNFMNLPGLSQLKERMVYYEKQVSKPCQRNHGTSSPSCSSSSSTSHNLLKQYQSLQNLPGLEELEDHYLASTRSKDSSRYFDGITDTDLDASVSLRHLGVTPSKADTPSSLNTLKDIDDIISTSPFIDLKHSERSDFEFFRVLVNSGWITARKGDLIMENSDIWIKTSDGEKCKVQQCVKVPCNYTPDDEIYLCDDKKYKVLYQGVYYTIPGSMILTTAQPNFCEVELNGKTMIIPSANINEKESSRPEFEKLNSYVAVRFRTKWHVLRSERLIPAEDNTYQLSHKSKVYNIKPRDIYPILRDADLLLGSNTLAESYIVKVDGKNYKVYPKSVRINDSCNETIQIRLGGKVHTVYLKSFVPNLTIPSAGKQSLTSTTSFSHPEYKHNIYCISINGTAVNIHGKDIKPHKSKPGYCKMKYKGKILRIKSNRIKLARQNIIDSKSLHQPVDFFLPQNISSHMHTSQIQCVQVNTTLKKKLNQVRYPHFSELIRQIPPIEEVSDEEVEERKEALLDIDKKQNCGGVLRVKIANKVKKVSKKKGLYIRCGVDSRDSGMITPHASPQFTLDVRPAPTLKVSSRSADVGQNGGDNQKNTCQIGSVELSNLRRSPFHPHTKTRSRQSSPDSSSTRLVIQCDSVASIPLECEKQAGILIDPH